MNYIKTNETTFELNADISLSNFNFIIKREEESLIAFGYSINDKFFEVNLIDKSICINGEKLNLSLPTGDKARWISFIRKTVTFPQKITKILGYGFGFQYKSGEKAVKRFAYYDLDSDKIVVEE